MFRMELQANGNGRQVMRPPPHCGSGTPYVFRTEVPVNGNGRQVTRPPPQGELRKQNAISVFIAEVQAADSMIGANEGQERHEVIQGLTFMCQNARGQGGELEEEKEGQSEWEARGTERQWRFSISDVT